jgi:hypothetical protein
MGRGVSRRSQFERFVGGLSPHFRMQQASPLVIYWFEAGSDGLICAEGRESEQRTFMRRFRWLLLITSLR